ncbi:hypothetical protein AAG570_011170 [Ranatra chinensis]|uniref:General transcription factor 3C polypeptide 3 n=1 Tax=Ranatra chinensis TaxID=642074 RepID=A0ABD0YJU7_9HEMI
MGEANLRYARGDKEMAVKICLEIIRQVPTAPEPFLTLAGIYDEMGDQEKCLQMSLVAAHLTSTDVYQWMHLAELSEQQGNVQQAIACYTKAINIDITNMELHTKRAAQLEIIGDKKTALRGYIRLLSSLTPEQGEMIISVSKLVAELCHKENDLVKASAALEVAVEKVPKLVNSEFVNLYLELLVQLKNYKRCLEVMVEFCDLVVEAETDDNDSFTVIECTIPPTTPVDILTKLMVVLIHMNGFHLIGKLMAPFEELDTSDVGELYLDVVEAYMEEGRSLEASIILRKLVDNENYSLPAVWLKYGEALKNLGSLEEAVTAYYKVLEQVPQHNEARMCLATILVELNRNEEAVVILTQNENESLDPALLYERCIILKNYKERSKELVLVAQLLFLRHSVKVRNREEITAISTIQRLDKKRATIRQVRSCRKEPEGDVDVPEFKSGSNGPSVEDEWELFKYVVQLCIDLKLFALCQQIVFTASMSLVFAPYKYEIDVLSVLAAYYNRDSRNGYNIVRTLVVKYPTNVKLWHLFNLTVTSSDEARHNRFIMRLLSHHSTHPALGVLHGNNCLVSGTYKYAMHEYSTTYSKCPTTLCSLVIGLTYLQMAAQKFTSKKHLLVVQSLGLMAEYQSKRGPEGLQEVHYNLGRGFHHLGLYTPAIYHYKQVLTCPKSDLAKEQPHVFDLSREAAFNLHLIYCHSESYDMAKMYLEKYIII